MYAQVGEKRMKRWNFLSVAMMSASILALNACEEAKVDASVYESVEQCKDDPVATAKQCQSSFKEAQDQHAAVAPKYSSLKDCQADFGSEKCEQAPYQTSSGGSVFMPMMMGYMMGSMMGGRGSMFSQPLYRSAQNPSGFRTADNRNVGAKTGSTQVARSATNRPSFKRSTMSRGGFGSSGRRFGSAAT
jgi:uncharacterized protein YgiB involved in biofilm formation